MNTVTITDDTLVVEPQGLDKVWALTRELRIPLGHVRGATVDPGAARDYKGLRNPGLGVPGVKWAGTFTLDRTLASWLGGYLGLAATTAGAHVSFTENSQGKAHIAHAGPLP